MEVIKMPVDKLMDKEVVLHIYNGILLCHKKSILARWMNVEPVIHSEVNQKEKNKYHVSTHIYEI